MGRRVRAGGLPGGWWGSLSLRRRRTAASMASLPHRIPAAPDIDIKSSITQLVPIPRATVRTEPHLSLLPPSPQATNDLTIQSSPFHCGASRCPGKKKKEGKKRKKILTFRTAPTSNLCAGSLLPEISHRNGVAELSEHDSSSAILSSRDFGWLISPTCPRLRTGTSSWSQRASLGLGTEGPTKGKKRGKKKAAKKRQRRTPCQCPCTEPLGRASDRERKRAVRASAVLLLQRRTVLGTWYEVPRRAQSGSETQPPLVQKRQRPAPKLDFTSNSPQNRPSQNTSRLPHRIADWLQTGPSIAPDAALSPHVTLTPSRAPVPAETRAHSWRMATERPLSL